LSIRCYKSRLMKEMII